MEISHFAEQILFGEKLSDKLIVPATGISIRSPFSDLSPGKAIAVPSGPGRPSDLNLHTAKNRTDLKKSARFPGKSAFETDRGRGMVLHYFANHELLALELMAMALLRFPDARGDWVRPGLMLYGASPLQDTNALKLGLKPVMTLKSAIIAIQQLKPGDSVGYGGLFLADRPMRIGVVACGYADGYPRHAHNGVPVLIEGVSVPMAGRVSMDMLCVDLTNVAHARVGSPAVLWGEGLPVEEVAAAAGTVSYELLCALARRVPVCEMG